MKRVFFVIALLMAFTLVSCGGDGNGSENNDNSGSGAVTTSAPEETLEYFELSIEVDASETPARARVGYPDDCGFVLTHTDWSETLTQSSSDVAVEFFISADYDCYAENQQAAKEEADFYLERKFGAYDGYVCMDDEDFEIEINIFFERVGDLDDVYMTVRIGSASLDMDVDPKAMYEMEDVQKVLSSITYISPTA